MKRVRWASCGWEFHNHKSSVPPRFPVLLRTHYPPSPGCPSLINPSIPSYNTRLNPIISFLAQHCHGLLHCEADLLVAFPQVLLEQVSLRQPTSLVTAAPRLRASEVGQVDPQPVLHLADHRRHTGISDDEERKETPRKCLTFVAQHP